MDELLKCLAARRGCGTELQQLNITESTFYPSDDTDVVATLREFVKDVTWDVQNRYREQSKRRDMGSTLNEVERRDHSSLEDLPSASDEGDN